MGYLGYDDTVENKYGFSKLSTDKCFKILGSNAGDLSKYSDDQIEEMIVVGNRVVVVSKEYDIIGAPVGVKEFEDYYKENFGDFKKDTCSFDKMCTARCNKIIKTYNGNLGLYSDKQLNSLYIVDNNVSTSSITADRMIIKNATPDDLVSELKLRLFRIKDVYLYSRPFSQLTDEEVWLVLEYKDSELSLYTPEQITAFKIRKHEGKDVVIYKTATGNTFTTNIDCKDLQNNICWFNAQNKKNTDNMKEIFNKPFSELSAEEVKCVIKEKGTNLDLYTKEQIGEMVSQAEPLYDNLIVKSINDAWINTDIKSSQLREWKKSKEKHTKEESIYDKPFSELSAEDALHIIAVKGNSLDLYTYEQIKEMRFDRSPLIRITEPPTLHVALSKNNMLNTNISISDFYGENLSKIPKVK